jgi:hypothetical protein
MGVTLSPLTAELGFASPGFSVSNTGAITATGLTLTGGGGGGSNITDFTLRSFETSIATAGTEQATATTLTKELNVISTVNNSNEGVSLPAAAAGMVIYIINSTATDIKVYPALGAAINSLATNAAYTHTAGATLQYIAPSSSQWYTVGATYS